MALLRDPDVRVPTIDPLLEGRWSPRAFDDRHVASADAVASMLEAARWAPSWGNSQPWAFIVGLRGDATFAAVASTLSRGNASWAPRASLLLVALCQVADGPERPLAPSEYAAYDLGQAVAHLTLQAHAMGLHAHQFAGFDRPAVAEALAVPPHWQVMSGIAIGRLADPSVLDERTREKELRPRSRRPVREFAFTGVWGQTPFGGGE